MGDRPPRDGGLRPGQHERALRAIDHGAFGEEIVPSAGSAATKAPAATPTSSKMAALEPLRAGGRITAALSSQIADGAAALLIASSRAVREHGLAPRARIAHLSARGDDPVLMLTAPIPATAYALQRPGCPWPRST